MEFFCSFCSKVEEEVPLIELSSNLLLINKSHYDFSKVFQDLFRITFDDLPSNFICESCKDSIVQFLIFKNNISCQMNQHLKMIMTQVEDFLLSQASLIEDIQVIRKLHSLTLLLANDGEPCKNPSIIVEELMITDDQEEQLVDQCDFMEDENSDQVPADDDDEPVEEIDYTCSKCDEPMKGNEDLEIHEFLKHSLLGIQIESEVENSNEMIVETENESTFIRKCALCSFGFEDSSSVTLHILQSHSFELLTSINEMFNIQPAAADADSIQKFIDHVSNLMHSNHSVIDEDRKKKFFEIYSGDAIKTNMVEEAFVESEGLSEGDDNIDCDEIVLNVSEVDFKQKKLAKPAAKLTDQSRAWLKKEIGLRKKATLGELGKERVIYQCVYCKKFSSNSASGFRYHLISKHLNDHNLEDLQEVEPPFHVPPKPGKTEKNTCFECNLKFKDQKLLSSHMNCHSLFAVIAQDYVFSSCNTCSKFFINESTLERHLEQHDLKEDVAQPIQVERGAIMLLAKLLIDPDDDDDEKEISDIEFSWKCGHCSKRFHKEELCRLHLLMVHVPYFVCPIEKREFHGFKAVSLFAHHLKNKHSHLFPEVTFPCTFCKAEFPSVYDKLSHMKNCNLKKFSCDHCGKKFFKKRDLVAHLKFVSGELFFPCRVCYKRCETMSDLKIHLRSHTKEKPFQCSVCTRMFRTLAGRSAHVETHNTSNHYTCFCGKTFKQRQMYRRHTKAMHEAEEKTDTFCVTSFEEVDEDSQ